MVKTTPAHFFKQVKNETSKVTWSSKKEITASTSMVLVLVVIASVFFLLVDWVVFNIVQIILGF